MVSPKKQDKRSQKFDAWDKSKILTAFEYFDGEYKRDQIDAALRHREDIVPNLIDILEKVNDNPEKYAHDPKYYAHIYALMLLGHFKECRAHPVIIDLFSLPGEIPETLFGDLITEELPNILIRTCNGSIEGIKGLILDKNANEYSRTSALQAFAYAVIEKIITRTEALSFLRGLFSGDEAEKGSGFYGQLTSCVLDLYPKELMDTLNDAYEKQLISPDYIAFENLKLALKQGKTGCLNQLRRKKSARSLDDLHKSMSWWACFRQEERRNSPVPAVQLLSRNAKNSEDKSSKKKKKSFWDL